MALTEAWGSFAAPFVLVRAFSCRVADDCAIWVAERSFCVSGSVSSCVSVAGMLRCFLISMEYSKATVGRPIEKCS